MNSGMSSTPIAVVDLIFVKVNDLGDGTFTGEANGLYDPSMGLSRDDATTQGKLKYGVVSIQEDWSVQWRAIGTAGAFERFLKVDSKTVQFSPRGTKAGLFAFSSGVLNS